MLSPVKIILLLLVIGAVVVVARMFRRNSAGNEGENPSGGLKSNSKSTELIRCDDCGTYVADLEGHECKK